MLGTMRNVATWMVGCSLVLAAGSLAQAKPKRSKAPAEVVEAAPEPAAGTIAAAAKEDPVLAAQLARLDAEVRTRIEAMTTEAFDAAFMTPEHSRTYEQETVVALMTAVQTVGEAAGANPELAALVTQLPAPLRARIEAMPMPRLQALIEQGPAAASPEDRELLEAFDAAAGAAFEAQLSYQHGSIALPDAGATLELGEGFRFLGPDDAERVLTEAWSNPPSDAKPLGMIVPAGMGVSARDGFGVVVTYVADGHVDDDDAEDIDYDELLAQMRTQDAADNRAREAAGLPSLTLAGWAKTPHYDAEHHRLYWARELHTPDAPATLNYDVRVLGRTGVLSLNAVGTMDQLEQIDPAMETLLAKVTFEQGARYDDFDPDIDQVAAYGIGGLIAGKVLLKTGLLAGLFKVLLAGKKLLLLLGAGIVAAVGAIFRKRKA
ncbi:MAG: DUF2167 domain-containing protein [Deltaproteobacteria bacterium]|nr:DUF2167 domain-containing protein [Deltaproteobacteria bacterium]